MGRKKKKCESLETGTITFHRDEKRIEVFVDWFSHEVIRHIEEQWKKG